MTPDSTHSLDREALVPVATAEDPATAERWTQLLKSEGIHVAHLPHGTGPVDVLTMGAHAWWELRVPESELVRARDLLEADAETEASLEDG